MSKGSKHVVVDIEANGPLYGEHSMISFGMVIVEPGFKRTFGAQLRPISESFVPEALAVSGFTHEQTKQFPHPSEAMINATMWLQQNIKGRPIFWSDNNGFDKPWMHWYFLKYGIPEVGDPFGHSSRRIADFICGVETDLRFQWKHKRRTTHDHNPVNDATGNAEVLLDYFINENIKYL